jgi:hypothetical protein
MKPGPNLLRAMRRRDRPANLPGHLAEPDATEAAQEAPDADFNAEPLDVRGYLLETTKDIPGG